MPADEKTLRFSANALDAFAEAVLSSSPRQLLNPGDRLARYEIVEEIARGGMGIVYLADDPELQRPIALKVIQMGGVATEEMIQRFQVEVRAAARLQHPHIVTIHDVGVKGHLYYYAMDLVEGSTLAALFHQRTLSLREGLVLLHKAAEAVGYAHTVGIVHRDLKPENILVDQKGEPQVTDFGLAKDAATDFTLTTTGAAMGTPAYMAPEQALGDPELTNATADVYALGAILYELVTGRPPFTAGSVFALLQAHRLEEPLWPRRLNPTLPRDVETICLKCLAKHPERRYSDAVELAADLKRFLDGEPILARPQSLAYRLQKLVMRHRGVSAAIFSGLTVAMMLVIGWGVTLTARTREAEHSAVEAREQRDAAILARRQAEAAHLLGTLSHELAPAELGDAPERLANLRRLETFARRHPDFLLMPEVEKLLNRERRQLREIVLDVTRNREIERVAGWGDALRAAGEQLNTAGSFGEEPLATTLADMIAGYCWMPMPEGKQVFVSRVNSMLRDLAPEHPVVARNMQYLREQEGAMRVLLQESFDERPAGSVLTDWVPSRDQPLAQVQGEKRALTICSTYGNSGDVSYPIEPGGARVVIMRCVLSVHSPTGDEEDEISCGLALRHNSELVCWLPVNNSTMFSWVEDGKGGRKREQMPIETDREYEVEIRYYVERQHFDVLVDGSVFVEEALPASNLAVTHISVTSGSGMIVSVDDITVLAGDPCLKRNMGDYPPIIDATSDLPLQPVAFVPILVPEIVVADLRGDQACEVVLPTPGKPTSLSISGFRGEDFTWQPPKEILDLPGASYVTGSGVIDSEAMGRRVVVLETWPWINKKELQRPQRLSVMRLGEDDQLQEVFAADYETEIHHAFVTPLRFADGRRGFAAGFAAYLRGYEVFVEQPDAKAPDLYRRLGFTHGGDPKQASDVLAISAMDWDGDGGDDLILGWGPWDWYCPAVVPLKNGVSAPPRPLTERTGTTMVATMHDSAGRDILITASRASRLGNGEHVTDAGLRVWRDGRLVLTQKGSYMALATGTLGGRSVCIVSQLHIKSQKPPIAHLEFTAYEVVDDSLIRCWDAILTNTPYADMATYITNMPQFHIADLNGDGREELLVHMVRQGFLVFSE